MRIPKMKAAAALLAAAALPFLLSFSSRGDELAVGEAASGAAQERTEPFFVSAAVSGRPAKAVSRMRKIPDKVSKTLRRKVAVKSIALETKTSMRIRWKRRKGADGYIVYRKLSGKHFRKVKKVGNGRRTEWTDRHIRFGRTYAYSVRAYRRYRGKTYFSPMDQKGMKKAAKVRKRARNGYRYLCDADGNRLENPEAFLDSPSYCLKVNLAANVLTVYARDGSGGYDIPVKAYLCSGNTWDRTGTFYLGAKYRFRSLYYNCYSQWASRIHDDILFHTVPYTRSMNPSSLDVRQYNLLGTSASHGCIRLQCAASKWINDHCPSGTRVVMYKSSSPGALGKPKLEKLPLWHTWDPTDPTMRYKCREKGCRHREAE